MPCELLPELQRRKDNVRCATLGAEVPGHRQDQLMQTLIVRTLEMHFLTPINNFEKSTEYSGVSDQTWRVPEEVIRSMAHKLEPPDPMSNPWEAFSFVVNAQLFRNSSKEILQTCRCVVKAAGNFDATQIRFKPEKMVLYFFGLCCRQLPTLQSSYLFRSTGLSQQGKNQG